MLLRHVRTSRWGRHSSRLRFADGKDSAFAEKSEDDSDAAPRFSGSNEFSPLVGVWVPRRLHLIETHILRQQASRRNLKPVIS